MRAIRNITKGMDVKETRAWIAEKRKNFKDLSWDEVNEFNREMELIRQEEDSRLSSKIERGFMKVLVWIGVAIIVGGSIWYGPWTP